MRTDLGLGDGVEVVELLQRDDEFAGAGGEIEAVDAVIAGVRIGHVVFGAIGIAVAGAGDVGAGIVEADGVVGADRIERARQAALFAGLDIVDHRVEAIIVADIVDDGAFGLG